VNRRGGVRERGPGEGVVVFGEGEVSGGDGEFGSVAFMLAGSGDVDFEVILWSLDWRGMVRVVWRGWWGWRRRRWERRDGTMEGGKGVEGVDAGFGCEAGGLWVFGPLCGR